MTDERLPGITEIIGKLLSGYSKDHTAEVRAKAALNLHGLDAYVREFQRKSKAQPMETAPKDGTEILIFAKWDWDGYRQSGSYSWRVAYWWNGHDYIEESKRKGAFITATENDYSDAAVDPVGWLPLPGALLDVDGQP